jgi:hypothetical protein
MKIQWKYKNPFDWHTWFAWYPVCMLEDGLEKIIWLQVIERKASTGIGGIFYNYRELQTWDAGKDN